LPQAIFSSEIAPAPAVAARAPIMLTSVAPRVGGALLRARITGALLALGGALLLAPGLASAAPPVLGSVEEARAASRDVTARIGELDARYNAEEKACMKTFFATPCANRARETYMKEKADLQVIKQHAELYLRVDADNIRKARVAENLSKAEEDQARRAAQPVSEPKTPKPAKTPTPSGKPAAAPTPPGEPGSSPLTDLGPMPGLPTESSKTPAVVKPLPTPKPDDSAQRAANREKFESKEEDAKRYAEQHEVRAAKAAADRERRRLAREADTKRLEGNAPPAGPSVVAPAAPKQ
jgi:hypothetical protein